jgi:hypothetical protein
VNGLLSNAILEVGVYATEGELLSCNVARLLEDVVMKLPFVTVIVFDFDTVLGIIPLKGTFGGGCFC